ncbi:capsule biosynthesis protein [Zavarzinia sp.]|uniref:capsule biosynthesis protein n=1 Tax=Zavarzinia sp. TaxID=2027920 RepID=UPI003BB55195|nr:capsular biosynthesis protein [Zavarzinia sp.]
MDQAPRSTDARPEGADAGPSPVPPRSYLFLQGPIGPFFLKLGLALRRRGHKVVRVNFNGGDLYDWPWPCARLYRGDAAGFPAWVGALARQHEITDIVLIGDCRPLHAAACETLRAWRPGIRVHVFEEGYLRPDNITLELDGVNASSSLPTDPEEILRSPEAMMPVIASEPVGPQTAIMGWRATIAYFCLFMTGWLFRKYRHHREAGPLAEWWFWVTRLLGRRRRLARVAREEKALLASGQAFYLALMQLNADKQIVFHSSFGSMRDFMAATIRSFADHAPAGTLLIFKGHPLDNGQTPHARHARDLARAAGVADRVHFLDGGNLTDLIGASHGVITINSTAGISALHRRVPLVVLGRAIYDMPGLTHQTGLDRFWTAPERPERALYMAWRQVVALRSQINGGFYNARGMALALPGALERLTRAARPRAVRASTTDAPALAPQPGSPIQGGSPAPCPADRPISASGGT